MTGVHLHLLVNHVPILGALFALALLVAARLWAHDVLTRAGLATLVVVGGAAAIAFFTGEPAEDAVRGLPGIRRAVIHEHEEMGETAWIAAGVVGVAALGGLWRWRRAPVPRAASLGYAAGAAVVSGLMAYTGLLGGRVRHTELRPGATAADAAVIEPRPVRPPEAPPR
jgi:uncharacterized membrane protein